MTTRAANRFQAIGDNASSTPGLATLGVGVTLTSQPILVRYGHIVNKLSVMVYVGSAAATTYNIGYQTLNDCRGWEGDQPVLPVWSTTTSLGAGVNASTSAAQIYNITSLPVTEAIRIVLENAGGNAATATNPSTTYPLGLGARVVVEDFS